MTKSEIPDKRSALSSEPSDMTVSRPVSDKKSLLWVLSDDKSK
jgi:hypothetical protein